MADKLTSPRLDSFIAKVIGDPSKPTGALLLTGFLGASSEAGHTRLYMDAGLDQYVDVPTDAILHTEPLASTESALGGSYIWLRKDAEVLHGKVGTDRQKARFLEGPIVAAFAGGAPGMAEPNIPFTPRCPSGIVPCPTDDQPCPSVLKLQCATHVLTHCPVCPPHTPACPSVACMTPACPSVACHTPACPTPACPTHIHTECPPCPTTIPIHCPTVVAAHCPSGQGHCITIQGNCGPTGAAHCLPQEEPAAQPAFATQVQLQCLQPFTGIPQCIHPATVAPYCLVQTATPNCYHPTVHPICYHTTQPVCYYTHQTACFVTRFCPVQSIACPKVTLACPIATVACGGNPFGGGGGGF